MKEFFTALLCLMVFMPAASAFGCALGVEDPGCVKEGTYLCQKIVNRAKLTISFTLKRDREQGEGVGIYHSLRGNLVVHWPLPRPYRKLTYKLASGDYNVRTNYFQAMASRGDEWYNINGSFKGVSQDGSYLTKPRLTLWLHTVPTSITFSCGLKAAAPKPTPTPAPVEYYIFLLTNASNGLHIDRESELSGKTRCSFEGGGINCGPNDVVTYSKLAGPFSARSLAETAFCTHVVRKHFWPLGIGLKALWDDGNWYGMWAWSVYNLCPNIPTTYP